MLLPNDFSLPNGYNQMHPCMHAPHLLVSHLHLSRHSYSLVKQILPNSLCIQAFSAMTHSVPHVYSAFSPLVQPAAPRSFVQPLKSVPPLQP